MVYSVQVLKRTRVKPSPPPPRCNIICWVWGGVSFHRSYHLVSVVPPLLSTIGGGGLLLLYPARYPVVSHGLGGTHTFYFHYLLLFVVLIPANSSLLYHKTKWSKTRGLITSPPCGAACLSRVGSIVAACRGTPSGPRGALQVGKPKTANAVRIIFPGYRVQRIFLR